MELIKVSADICPTCGSREGKCSIVMSRISPWLSTPKPQDFVDDFLGKDIEKDVYLLDKIICDPEKQDKKSSRRIT